MKPILFFDHSPVFGGAERSLLDIITRLSQYVCILVGPRGDTLGEAEKRGIETRQLEIPQRLIKRSRKHVMVASDFFLLPLTVFRLLWLIREIHPSIIYTNTLKAHIIGGIASKMAGIPCVVHMRDILDGHKLYLALVSVMSTRMIAISRAVKSGITYKKDISVVYNGIDIYMEREKRKEGGVINIGAVGQIARWKGAEYFVRAAGLLHRKYGDGLRFWIVGDTVFGDDDYRRHLVDIIEELGLSEYTEFTGWVTSPLNAMEKLDIIVHIPIRDEPFGRVLIEAGLLGKPVVATKVGAVPEIIMDGKTGVLVPPRDANAVYGALCDLIDDGELRRTMGNEARKRVEKIFSIDKTVEAIAKILKELTG